jgi:general secretion pathway protein L
MSETLLIHYNINDTHQATWALCNDAGELTGKITTGTLNELTELANHHPVVVLLNSQCLHINKLKLPTTNAQKMLKAVPFAVEEFIAGDIENFHFVISKNKHDATTSVVGIDKSTLQNIIQAFQQADITVEKIIPDALCLAADTERKQWACLNFNDDSYLQTDPLYGMTFSNDIFPYIIDNKLQDEDLDRPEKILFFTEQENPSAFDAINIEGIINENTVVKNPESEGLDTEASTHGSNIEVINIVYNTHPLVIFCGHYRQALPLNLLQQEFKTRRKSSGIWQHWRLAASLAVIWLVLHLGLTGFQYSRLANENKITKAKIEKIYKSAFPKSRKIVNPRVQMEQKLKELKNNSGTNNNGLIFLLAESFGTLNSDIQNITLQSLTFRNNRMDIGLDSSNLQTIESLNQKLNKSTQIKSEITSSTSEKNKVKGNLRIVGRS